MRQRGHNRRALVSLVCGLPLLMPDVSIAAQGAREAQHAHRMAPRHRRANVDDQVELLARYLELSDGQRSSLKSILERRQQEILSMRSAHVNSDVAPTDTFRAIEDQTARQIRALLNEEQRKKYEPLSNQNSAQAAQQQSAADWLKTARPR